MSNAMGRAFPLPWRPHIGWQRGVCKRGDVTKEQSRQGCAHQAPLSRGMRGESRGGGRGSNTTALCSFARSYIGGFERPSGVAHDRQEFERHSRFPTLGLFFLLVLSLSGLHQKVMVASDQGFSESRRKSSKKIQPFRKNCCPDPYILRNRMDYAVA